MAARTVLTSDTLETFRTTFNSLSTTDIGDPATLTTTATSVVGAINELNASTYGGFTIVDSGSSTTQPISSGDTLTFDGDSNITATVSATDTVTFTLNSTITGLTSITSTTFTDGTATLTSGSLTGLVNVTGSGTANFTTDVQVNGISVATSAFAIAQAVALG
jgi:hypothetical protein